MVRGGRKNERKKAYTYPIHSKSGLVARGGLVLFLSGWVDRGVGGGVRMEHAKVNVGEGARV